MHRAKSNVLAGFVVAGVHVAGWLCAGRLFGRLQEANFDSAKVSTTRTYIIAEPNGMDVVPMPEVLLERVNFDAAELTQVRFEDAEQGDIADVVAPVSAPRLTETCSRVCDPRRFATAAGLKPGQSVTVVLVIEVLKDGSTGSIGLLKSSGIASADAASLLYVRSLHWIPGTRNRQAQAMRIRFPVTLELGS